MNITIYTRPNCSLCEKAKAAIRASGVHAKITEIDIDENPELRLRYTDNVPVIFVDGEEAFRHRVDVETLRRWNMPNLANEKCIPCRGGVPALKGNELRALEGELGGGWRVVDEHHLEKEFAFPDFAGALAFTNRVGAVAEEEGHHPDIYLAWGNVRIQIWTHKIDGLTRSDFILAAKIERL
jgi:4a-hydroxytetrahydrobiopterin dehydratase